MLLYFVTIIIYSFIYIYRWEHLYTRTYDCTIDECKKKLFVIVYDKIKREREKQISSCPVSVCLCLFGVSTDAFKTASHDTFCHYKN